MFGRRIQPPCVWSKLKVGDIVFAYRTGVHIITKITPRGNSTNPFATVKRISRGTGVLLKKPVEYQCDIGFCRLAKKEIIEEIEILNKLLTKIEKLESDDNR